MNNLKKLALSVAALLLFIIIATVAAPRVAISRQPGQGQERSAEHEGLGTYFPSTEKLGPDEMRVVSCGTGMPMPRKSQAATSWLVELGNGEKFIFDIGSESAANVGSLNIPYDFLDKIFLTHLHSDHAGDLANLWIGGWVMAGMARCMCGDQAGRLPNWGPRPSSRT